MQNQTLTQKRLCQSRSLVYSGKAKGLLNFFSSLITCGSFITASTVIKPTTAGGKKPKPLKRSSLGAEAPQQLSIPKSHVKQVTSKNKDIRTKTAKTTPTVLYDSSPSKKSYYRPTQGIQRRTVAALFSSSVSCASNSISSAYESTRGKFPFLIQTLIFYLMLRDEYPISISSSAAATTTVTTAAVL